MILIIHFANLVEPRGSNPEPHPPYTFEDLVVPPYIS